MDLTVFGHTGFVGSAFVNRYRDVDDLYLPPRYSRRPNPYKKTDILYLISTTHNYNVFTDPTLDVKTNLVVLTEALDSWQKNNPEGVFNFVSSWFVYGEGRGFEPGGLLCPNKNQLVDEHANCHPKGFYSITKYAAEQLLVSFAETFGLRYRILRLCNIIGPGDKGASKQKNAFQYLLNEMQENRPIQIYEKGQFYRTYMDVEDCASALSLVMEKGNLNEIYNIGTEPAQVFMDMISFGARALNTTSRIEFIEQKDFHKKVQVKSFSMDCSKLYGLGFQPRYSIQDTIYRMIK
jgi:nucleoside-diphosphate-sugar epimerase